MKFTSNSRVSKMLPIMHSYLILVCVSVRVRMYFMYDCVYVYVRMHVCMYVCM